MFPMWYRKRKRCEAYNKVGKLQTNCGFAFGKPTGVIMSSSEIEKKKTSAAARASQGPGARRPSWMKLGVRVWQVYVAVGVCSWAGAGVGRRGQMPPSPVRQNRFDIDIFSRTHTCTGCAAGASCGHRARQCAKVCRTAVRTDRGGRGNY